MFKIKNIFSICLVAAVAVPMLSSCNDDWKEEQYEHYIGFKAPLDTDGSSVGVTTVYVPFTRYNEDGTPRYGKEGITSYQLPVIVAGSTHNDKNLTVNIAHSDTLDILNVERFGDRSELYYRDMSEFADVPETIFIPEGVDAPLLDIHFDFTRNGGIDLVDRYVLPLTIAPGEGYERNPRKNFASAMLRVLPFTDYSGIYQAGNLKYGLVDSKGEFDGETSGMNTVQTYVVSQNEVFFYAGTFDETSQLRKYFKINAEFVPDHEGATTGNVILTSDIPEMEFVQNGMARFNIIEAEDAVQNYIMRRTVIVNGIDYSFIDYKTAGEGVRLPYRVTGTMTMERKLNTQMPIEDQILWD